MTTSLRRLAAPLALALLVATAAACGTGSTSPATTSTGGGGSTTAPAVHGTADVAYAGSLVELAEKVLGPAFEKATGFSYVGRGAGSTTLAQEILSKEISPGVFLPVGRKAIEKLEPSRAKFAIELATDPLVVAYNPHSKYAPQLEAIAKGTAPLSSLFSLMAEPGFKLGRTDPNVDPQGAYFILTALLAVKVLGLPADTAAKVLGIDAAHPYGNSSQLFDETSLEPTLQAGELDAASVYVSQAKQLGLPYITLPPTLSFADPAHASTYAEVSLPLSDGTVKTGDLISLNETLIVPPATSPGDVAANNSFVSYLLSSGGRALLRAGGYTLVTPQLYLAPGVSASEALPSSVMTAFNQAGGQIASS